MYEEGRQGVSISQISRDDGVNWRTAKKYKQSPEPPKYTERAKGPTKLDPYRDYIKGRLAKWNLTAWKLFEEIQGQGYTGSYTLVKEFVRPIKKDRAVIAQIRYETKPCVQSQVDWFDFGYFEVDGERRHLWCFSMILGYSRMRFITFTTNTKTGTFIQCHIDAYRFFNGYTNENLYDNTTNVVIHRALKSSDSTWNPLFRDFMEYYGFKTRLCKPGIEGAKTKGKIENTGKYIRMNFFTGLDFSSIQDLNDKAILWCNKVNSRVHGTTNEIPLDRFKTEGLNPIDSKPPYQIVLTEFRKVSVDCYVSYQGNKYSVPWKFAGREAKLLIKDGKIDVEIGGNIVCLHDVVAGNHRCIKVKEHFEGLYKEIRQLNKERHIRRLTGMVERPDIVVSSGTNKEHPVVDVQKRDLKVYDQLAVEGLRP